MCITHSAQAIPDALEPKSGYHIHLITVLVLI